MTELQFKEYVKTIVGKPVRQFVVIGNVAEDGKIVLSGDWSPLIFNVSEFCVVVTGAPKDVALTFDAGDRAYLEATINGVIGNYNYYINCEYTLLLTYKSLE